MVRAKAKASSWARDLSPTVESDKYLVRTTRQVLLHIQSILVEVLYGHLKSQLVLEPLALQHIMSNLNFNKPDRLTWKPTLPQRPNPRDVA
jgi:hypothetical protein